MTDLISMTWPEYRRSECRYRGRHVHLAPAEMRLFFALLVRRGELLTHDDLVEAVYPDPDASPECERHIMTRTLYVMAAKIPGVVHNEHGRGFYISLPAEQIRKAA